jgi:anti-sigma regulatory factor (Ser/Thr protein kinase)
VATSSVFDWANRSAHDSRGGHTCNAMAGQPTSPERVLADFSIESRAGNERIATRQVAHAVRPLGLGSRRLQRLETAVSEAALNAMEHGNHFDADKPVRVRVVASDTEVIVSVCDCGAAAWREPTPEVPDIQAKLADRQSPRGWGLFLMTNMVDEVTHELDGCMHCVKLRMRLSDQ